MEPLPDILENLTFHVIQIKWLTMALMVIFIIGLAVISYLFLSLKKLFKGDPVSSNFRVSAKTLLNMNDLESLIELTQERIKQFPGEIFAHWYLGLAYYRKKEWHKALYEFNYIYEIDPSWRYKHLNPYIYDIKEQLKNTRPEIIKK
jgi:tetratricopeptide (TPR) repeat protein